MEKPMHWGKRISIHLEVNNICNAFCPMCYDRNYINDEGELKSHPRRPNRNLEFTRFSSWLDDEFYREHSLKKLTICGTESEPSLNPDLDQIICYAKSRQRTTLIRISTNGATNSPDWWFRIGSLMRQYGKSVQFIFSIDGIGSSHETYRLGTSYETVIMNAEAFIAGGGTAVWQFLVFRHNEDQVDTGRKIANKMGFYDFYLKYSNYFNRGKIERLEYNYKGENYSLEESTTAKNPNETENPGAAAISCYSFATKEVFIDYEGYLYPCSWFKSSLRGSFDIKSTDDAWKVVRQFQTDRSNLDQRSIHQILNDQQLWNDLSDAWSDSTLRPRVCELYCTTKADNTQCCFQMGDSNQIVKQAMIH